MKHVLTLSMILVLFATQSMADDFRPLPEQVPSPADNPLTPEKVELGKKLYFDPRLSLTGTVSCNTCHNLMEGGDDGRPTSMGVHGLTGPRNAPTVWNSAFQASQFWDGRAATLEEQAQGPIVAAPEMGMPSHDAVISRIQEIPEYVAEFRKVFGTQDAVTIGNAAKAIGCFERTLITPNSPFDRYLKGDRTVLTSQQIRGMKTFADKGCTECHSGPALNGWSREDLEPEFVDFPRYPSHESVKIYDLAADPGRFEATGQDADRNTFKVPILRNITLTAPYFHNGAVPTLAEAVRIMGETQLDVTLSDAEVSDIVAFLETLEGTFPEITLPRIPSRSGKSILEDVRGTEGESRSHSDHQSAVPRIEGVGQVKPFPEAAEQPEDGAKIVVDLTAGSDPAEVNPGLKKVARFVNIFAQGGKTPARARLVVVLHGGATPLALDGKAYAKAFGTGNNPNSPLLQTLTDSGVNFVVCGQSLTRNGFQPEQLSGNVDLAVSAMTALTNRQSAGYAYIPVGK